MCEKEVKHKIEKLIQLKVEEKKYDFIRNFSSSTIEEFDAFVKANETAFKELKEIKTKIEALEFSLMNGPEKEAYIKYLSELKDKFSSDL